MLLRNRLMRTDLNEIFSDNSDLGRTVSAILYWEIASSRVPDKRHVRDSDGI